MRLSTNIILVTAALATSATTFAVPLSLDQLLGFSSDPQAGFDERTHGKVWVNGKGPGREYAEGYGLGKVRGHKVDKGRQGWAGWMDEEMKDGKGGAWAELWEVIVGGPSKDHHQDHHEHDHPMDRRPGSAYQAVPKPSHLRNPHANHHGHGHHEHEHPGYPGIKHGVHPATGPGSGRFRGPAGGHRMIDGSRVGHVRDQGCFFSRFIRALSHLEPHESILIIFTLLLGALSVLKLGLLLVILVRRSHRYATEVDSTGQESGGYPGAEFRRRREEGYERVRRDEREADLQVEKQVSEKE